MYRTVLSVRRRVLGEEHPNTLTSMHDLADAVLCAAGQHAEAVEMYRTVLPVRRRVLGEEHGQPIAFIDERPGHCALLRGSACRGG